MKSVKKIVLALAATTMLASCAKEITRAEAIEIARGYEASNFVYKSGKVSIVTTVSFSDNVPEAMKSGYKPGTQEQELTTPEEILSMRLSAATVEAAPESAKFKADGKALEISYTEESSELGGKMKVSAVTKTDENGWPVSGTEEMFMSVEVSQGTTYTITVKAVFTGSWVK